MAGGKNFRVMGDEIGRGGKYKLVCEKQARTRRKRKRQ